MKVTTDGCLFGALQPQFPEEGKGKKIMDIGTGTGLLSLMTAQLNPKAQITAIEIEPATAREAFETFSASPFKEQIEVVEEDILVYNAGSLFHLIICNPPFYEWQLKSPDKNRNKAHHSTTLQLNQLFALVTNWLEEEGILTLLLPFYREEEALKLGLEHGLFCEKIIRVRQTPRHEFFRIILYLGKQPATKMMEEITIRNENNAYTPAFQDLLRPFYLNI